MKTYQYNDFWLVQAEDGFIGGRYDSESTASLAIEKLDRRFMEELWMKIASQTSYSSSTTISAGDIEEYLGEAFYGYE